MQGPPPPPRTTRGSKVLTYPLGPLGSLNSHHRTYRGTSPIRNTLLLGPYGIDYLGSDSGPRVGGCFL